MGRLFGQAHCIAVRLAYTIHDQRVSIGFADHNAGGVAVDDRHVQLAIGRGSVTRAVCCNRMGDLNALFVLLTVVRCRCHGHRLGRVPIGVGEGQHRCTK